MKAIKKIVALGIGALMSVAVLTGCSTDDMALYRALNKSQDITTATTKTEMSLNLSAENLSAQEAEMVQGIMPMLNNSKLTVTSKMEQNKEKTIAKVESNIEVKSPDMSINMGVWVDTDLTKSQPEFREIVKLPTMFTSQVPELAGKEYMVIDFEDMANIPGAQQPNFEQIMEFSKDFQGKLVDFIDKYAAQFKPSKDIVKRVGSETIVQNGVSQSAEIYEIKFDDATFKELLRYTANNFAQNEDAIAFIKEYMLSSLSVSGLPQEELAAAKAEMEKVFADYESNLPQFLEEMNAAFDELDGIKILGQKGITIRFAVNADGYVINEKGNMEFVLDLGQMNKDAAANGQEPVTGVYTIGLEFNSDITNINKPVTITFPVLTASNSVSFSDLMESTIPNPKPEIPVVKTGWVLENGNWKYNDSNGVSKKGWLQDGGKWYYLNKDGVMSTGWVKERGNWFYLNNDGTMAEGWVKQGGTWYFMGSDGTMKTGWVQIGSKWYYLNTDGSMAHNTKIGSHKLGADGAWVK
ncbi:hypothetical protein [Clostridium sp.]|uniref:N-acetylmuramoyl-L-alanine amidase family protein n=1 Tax=Clostridium sp. TaxID=1506 RepID=UPI002FCB4948